MDGTKTSVLLPPLTCAALTLARVDARVSSLRHVVDLVSSFLDASLLVKPARAIMRGDTQFFSRIETRLLQDPEVDPAAREHWLTQAMLTAVEHDDLAIVQRLHGLLPDALVVSTLRMAVKHASLEVVQWIVENRHDAMCADTPGVRNLCSGCLTSALLDVGADGAAEKMMWLADQDILDPFDGDFDALVCLPQTKEMVQLQLDHVGFQDGEASASIEIALSSGDIATATLLMDSGYRIRDETARYELILAANRGDEVTVEFMLAHGLCDSFTDKFLWAASRPGGEKVLRWDRTFMNENSRTAQAMQTTASSHGNLDVLRWLYEELSLEPILHELQYCKIDEDTLLTVYQWMNQANIGGFRQETMDKAATNGQLRLVQWLHEHSTAGCSAAAMDGAAANGHLNVVKWLHENRPEGCTDAGLYGAAGNGHLEVVKCLHEHGTRCSGTTVVVSAAEGSHLDIVMWLSKIRDDWCSKCAIRAVLGRERMENGITTGILRWLRSKNPAHRCDGQCFENIRGYRIGYNTSPLVVRAAYTGNIPLLEYLHEHHQDHLNLADREQAIRTAAQLRHQGTVQWLRDRATS